MFEHCVSVPTNLPSLLLLLQTHCHFIMNLSIDESFTALCLPSGFPTVTQQWLSLTSAFADVSMLDPASRVNVMVIVPNQLLKCEAHKNVIRTVSTYRPMSPVNFIFLSFLSKMFCWYLLLSGPHRLLDSVTVSSLQLIQFVLLSFLIPSSTQNRFSVRIWACACAHMRTGLCIQLYQIQLCATVVAGRTNRKD